MEFRLFFLQEKSRTYDKPELITLLTSNPNITPPDSRQIYGDKVYTYHHNVLNFEANFIMASKSVVPHLELLPPKFFDVNFFISFDILLSNYAVEMILDIIEEIVKKFRFYVYCEPFEGEVRLFRRAEIIRTFDAWKKAFAAKFPDQVAGFNRLDSQSISAVYGYLQKRKRLEITYSEDKIQVSDYIFLHTAKSRSAFVAIQWDGDTAFLLPPAVDILIYDDGKISKHINMAEVLSKAEKLFRPIDGYGVIKICDAKNTKKLKKILLKERFAPLNVDVEILSLDKILDV